MTREEKEQTGKYVLQMARLLEDGCYQQEMLLKAVHIIDEALEQEPTTKNDLGVDCIDKTELLKAMDTWDKFGDDPNEGLILLSTPALQDRYVPYVKYDDMVNCVKNMPSVTPQEPRWTPVSERLPENKETVLVTFKHFVSGNTIGLGSVILLRGKPHWHVREQNLGTYDVLAWMPLPKTYEPQES